MNRLLLVALPVSVLVGALGCAPASGPAPGPDTATVASAAATVACHVVEGKADQRCTPGVTNPAVTQATIGQTICRPGWTKTIRPPVSYTNDLKRKQMAEYGETGSPSDYEEDHLVALEAGGDPRDPRNLFPQPRAGTHGATVKDTEENQVHAAICAGKITLKQGQDQLVQHWTHS